LRLDQGRQRVYAMGLLDGMHMAPVLGAPEGNRILMFIARCAEGMKASQIAAIIDKYVRDHPERWHWDLKDAGHSGMLDACRAS